MPEETQEVTALFFKTYKTGPGPAFAVAHDALPSAAPGSVDIAGMHPTQNALVLQAPPCKAS